MKINYPLSRLVFAFILMLLTTVISAGTGELNGTRGFEAVATLLAQAPTPQPAQAPPPPPTPQQRVAMLKQWMQASQMQLRAYEWMETTVMLKSGEEKSRKVNQIYYSVGGKQLKIPVNTGEEKKSGGPRGLLPIGRIAKRVAKRKQENLIEYMQSVSALVQSYVPPDANLIQQSINAGNFSANMVEPGRRIQLEFRNYIKSGDSLKVNIELPTNRLLGLEISSYLESQKDAVQLDVVMDVLPDGTIYTSKTTLNAPAEKITVIIENTDYRRTAG